MSGGYYRTGDVATRDQEGYFWFVGRADDLFKSSDYRISPFEIESVLIESPAVAEAAVIPAPDPIRGYIPKAYVTLVPGFEPSIGTAKEVFDFVKTRVAPFKRLRRIEFVTDLPKTISGKIRRVQLRSQEANKDIKGEFEFLADEMK
jgi:acetyl-CoA synthetase